MFILGYFWWFWHNMIEENRVFPWLNVWKVGLGSNIIRYDPQELFSEMTPSRKGGGGIFFFGLEVFVILPDFDQISKKTKNGQLGKNVPLEGPEQ